MQPDTGNQRHWPELGASSDNLRRSPSCPGATVMMVLQVRPRRANRRDLPIRAIQDGPHLSLSLHLAYRSSVTAPAARRPLALTCRAAQRAFTLTSLSPSVMPSAGIAWLPA